MRKKWVYLSILVLVILTMFYFDAEIVKGISLFKMELLNYFFVGLTFVSNEMIVFFFLTGLFLWKEKGFILPLWTTLGLSVVVSFLLKVVVQRPRPFQLGIVSLLPVLEKANHFVWNFSFPSFQTMLLFSVIPLLSKKFPKLKYYWIVFACLVGFSRIYFGLHFPSDVIAGGAIGYLLGVIVIRLEKRYKFGEKVYRKIFT